MKIFLTGFMGCGKSHFGRHLAENLDYSFLDLDDFLERGEKQSISQIFEERGETAFRKIESIYLKKTINLQNHVIATGGGTPCFFDNMNWMNEHGFTVFLDVEASILAERLMPEKSHRPLLADKSQEELLHFISKKLKFRRPFYEQARLIYQANKGFHSDLANLVAIFNRNFQ